MLLTCSIVLANFQFEDKQGKIQFFQKTFLVADTAMKVILKMAFLTFDKVKINFADEKLNQKTYFLDKSLLTTKQMQMIDQKNFMAAALALNKEVFIV